VVVVSAAAQAVTVNLHLAKAALVATVAVIAVVLVVVALGRHKVTASVAVQITHAPQTATFAKVVSTTATVAVVSLPVGTLLPVAIQRLAAISHLAVTLPHARNSPHVVTLHLVKTSLLAVSATISRLAATSPHVKISPLAVTPLRAVILQTVNQHSQSLALPSQRLLNQQPNQAMAAKCLCHAIWRKHVRLRLSNISFKPSSTRR
jgi:hypothetical protein